MITPPSTYAEWVEILEMLKVKENDGAVLSAMQEGTIEWQSGVAERFSQRLVDTINHRMNTASDKFQREMGRANGEERAITQSILALRKEMAFLFEAINIPAIPEDIRNQYCQLVKEQADNMQKSLEDSAKKDRTGKLSRIVRNTKVNAL